MALKLAYIVLLIFTSGLTVVFSCEIAEQSGDVTCTSLAAIKNNEIQSNWTKLTIKNYGNESLATLPDDAFRSAPNLETELVVDGLINKLQTFSFRGLAKLNELKLENNDIKELPEGVFDNLSVKRLMIMKSKLRVLKPGIFDKMLLLKIVTLSDNEIKTIPRNVFENTNVSHVQLSNNLIDYIEDCAFCNIEDLSYLVMHSNKLTAFEPERILGHSPLRGVGLDENGLTTVPRFRTTPDLVGASFSNNSIDKIEDEAFVDCKKLQLVDFSNNRLEAIPANIFPVLLPDLEPFFLIIHGNSIECLSKEVRNKIPKLRRITVNDNPWKCECLNDVINWAKGLDGYIACEFIAECVVPCIGEGNIMQNVTIIN